MHTIYTQKTTGKGSMDKTILSTLMKNRRLTVKHLKIVIVYSQYLNIRTLELQEEERVAKENL